MNRRELEDLAAVRATASAARLPRAEAARLPVGSRLALELAADVRFAIARSAGEVPGALTIAVGDGYLVVRGRVASPEARDEVLGIARAAAGGTRVVDKLVIVR